jgi:aspartate ammonia-lyase
MEKVRVEEDLLGAVEVPLTALYGAQTRRAILNFPLLASRAIGDYPEMLDALMIVKKAAANTNLRTGYLDSRKASAVGAAADKILAGGYSDQFPIHCLHGGGGTSANMNANEVIANLAEESLGGCRGAYRIVHPNDDVNLHQSTNDVYPTACHIAIVRRWPVLDRQLRELSDALLQSGREWADVPRIARTCLQDAVEITFLDLLGAYAAFVTRGRVRIDEAVDRLHEVNLGGTIVGRANDVPGEYFDLIIEELRNSAGDEKFSRPANLFLAAQSPDDLIAVSSALDLLARGLVKIGKDFRLIASGPETGFGEVRLPAVQPGSSIMPGKVNPVVPEFMIQLCMQVAGKHAACVMALDHGELDLNVWEGLIVFNILDSMELIANAVSTFREKCLRGIQPNLEKNRRNVATVSPLVNRLMRKYGYSTISQVCKKASGDTDRIRILLAEKGLI